jgi:hypothetical protein
MQQVKVSCPWEGYVRSGKEGTDTGDSKGEGHGDDLYPGKPQTIAK